MTELRKRILDGIFEREKKQIQIDIRQNEDYVKMLKEKINGFEEEKRIARKYNICIDNSMLKAFLEVEEEYYKQSIDKKIAYIINAVYVVNSIIAYKKGYGVECYIGINIINSLKEYIQNMRNEVYDPKKYKLLKKQYKDYLSNFRISASSYSLREIIEDLDDSENFVFDDIRTCNDQIKYLYNQMRLLELVLFNSKVSCINNELKVSFDEQESLDKYKHLSTSFNSFLPYNMNNVKVKTLKNKVIIK